MKEEYYKIIRKVFPNGLLVNVGNFDDMYFGCDICPTPGILIRFGIDMNNEMFLKIEYFRLVTLNCTVIYKRIFSGRIPPNSNNEPDFEFIEQLLRYYQQMG